MDTINYSQEQHSIEWYRDRLGCITGSKVSVLLQKGRAKDEAFSQTARTYLCQLAGERALSPAIVGDDKMLQFYIEQTTAQSKAMRFGTEQEPNARRLYAELTGNEVREVGLCHHATLPTLASSPDGIVSERTASGSESLGTIEVKCPGLAAYTQYVSEIMDNETLLKTNRDYYYQCQCHMACTGADFCDFVVYCPFVENPIHIVRIVRDREAIRLMEERVKMAEEIIDSNYKQLKRA